MSLFNKLKHKPGQSHIRPLPQAGKAIIPVWDSKIGSRLCWVLLLLILTLLILPNWQLPTQMLNVGDICPNDIKAPFDFSVEDKATTFKRQNEALEQVLAVYDFDSNISKVSEQVYTFFDRKTKFYEGNRISLPVARENETKLASSEPPAEQTFLNISQLTPEERWKLFSRQSNINIALSDYMALEEPLFDQPIINGIQSLITAAMRQGIVGNKDLLVAEDEKGITKRDLRDKTEQVVNDVYQFLDMEQAREYIKNTAASTLVMDKLSTRIAVNIAQQLIQPNLFFNKSETEERKRLARENVKPVFFQIKKGEMIIREGERVKEDQLAKHRALRNLRKHHALPFIIPGLILLSGLVLYFMRYYIKRFRPKLERKHILLLILILVGTLSITKLFGFIANVLSIATPDISSQAYYYAIPFAAGALLVSLLVDAQLGVLFAVVVAIFTGLQLKQEFNFFIISLLGGIGAVYGVTQQQSRTAILRAGLLVSGINLAVIIPFNLIKSKLFTLDVLYECLGGAAGGLMVATIASAGLPLLEYLFKITTDIRLLELSNLNQPLLKQLALEAPGTYHHSIIVGSLAEAAAEAICANPLFSRISAYYHDIGKINKAEYFIENHPEADKKHKKLSPNMSGLIIISHVKDGLELASQYKLPPPISDVIQQHHGTSLMRYFYHKAKEQESPLQTINENDYRYPGPKPQTKESGIIMLADAVEATSRTLTDPTPARLSSMVRRVINDIYHDGQLDACDLTLKNLSQIAESFMRILTSVFHTRIDYPDLKTIGVERSKTWKSKSKIGKGA
jgi:putative nucleotidyltransferase with HDIG domain